MNRRSPLLRLFALLCLLAWCSAQAFGMSRGYHCDCSGVMEWTAADHCHGPHEGDCHREPAEAPHDETGSGERHDHDPLRDDVQSRLTPALDAPALVPLLIAVLENIAWSLAAEIRVSPTAQIDLGTGPPLSVAIARTIVLLI